MKKTLLLFIVFFVSNLFYAQSNKELIIKIEDAKTMQEMPVITVTINRPSNNVGIRENRYNTIRKITQGEKFTFYFPIQIFDKSGKWTQANESYNFVALEQTMTSKTPIIHTNVISYLNKEDSELFRKWLFKYQALGKELMQEKVKPL